MKPTQPKILSFEKQDFPNSDNKQSDTTDKSESEGYHGTTSEHDSVKYTCKKRKRLKRKKDLNRLRTKCKKNPNQSQANMQQNDVEENSLITTGTLSNTVTAKNVEKFMNESEQEQNKSPVQITVYTNKHETQRYAETHDEMETEDTQGMSITY